MFTIEANIHYVLGKEDLLDNVKTLWEELNKLHSDKSPYYKDFYANNTFEARKTTLLSTAQKGQVCVVLAYDASLVVGYCIASVVDDTGEIDSIFVSGDYRKMGIAGNLMDKVLSWLKQSNPRKIVIKVSVGNEEVFGFYAKYGFYPCLTELQMLPD
ncbi:hypothetical protein MsAg5_15750 [Methanosarcinaceae archaeon Ag5]|uniref:N-acetyltransferase domain-containing protein n=1 Tax=Methanolapillus africanus TaxID=3028297 RepID=A0AAE4MKM2_9EURY|nr:hypothetical protein [Methanosarcinaceae archaeon Ag5]